MDSNRATDDREREREREREALHERATTTIRWRDYDDKTCLTAPERESRRAAYLGAERVRIDLQRRPVPLRCGVAAARRRQLREERLFVVVREECEYVLVMRAACRSGAVYCGSPRRRALAGTSRTRPARSSRTGRTRAAARTARRDLTRRTPTCAAF
jgi:hypothetical protein